VNGVLKIAKAQDQASIRFFITAFLYLTPDFFKSPYTSATLLETTNPFSGVPACSYGKCNNGPSDI
jgi:hypothetical protein